MSLQPPLGTAVEQMARFARDVRVENLPSDLRALYKRNILDSIGCAIAALPGQPFSHLRSSFAHMGGSGRCRLIGGGTASVERAALFNTSLVRYVDLLDSFMSSGGLCHPADNFGGVLAAADASEADGEDFLLALAIAYEIGCRFTATVPVMAKGFNHALQLAMSVAAASARLNGADTGQIANAIAIAAVDNVSLAAVHSEPVSQWKGFSPGMTAMRAVYAADLAQRGFTGPLRLFEGPNGLERMFDQQIRIDWSDHSLDSVRKTVFKKYCALIHGQPVIEAVLALKRRHGVTAREVDSVLCEVFQSGFDIAGGGGFGPKDRPQTKEQADYNLKYLVAAALLDGQVGPAQLEEARIRADDAQALLAKVQIRPADEFTARYPDELGCRVTIHLRDGRTFSQLQRSYEGGLDKPLSWRRVVDKFHWLAEPFATSEQRDAIVQSVQQLDEHPLADLLELLSDVRADAGFSRTLPAIG